MKKPTVLFFLVFITLLCSTHAVQRAVTDEGEVVILNDDGTWKYENQNSLAVNEIKENPKLFFKDRTSTFPIKSKVTQTRYWINPRKWSFEKGGSEDAAEYSFQLRGGDLFGQAINEGLEISIDGLGEIALSNFKDVSPGAEITFREYRNVNGVKVLYQVMEGSLQGMDLIYYGYYFSNSAGTTQYLIITGKNLASKYRSDIEEFLNGFDVFE